GSCSVARAKRALSANQGGSAHLDTVAQESRCASVVYPARANSMRAQIRPQFSNEGREWERVASPIAADAVRRPWGGRRWKAQMPLISLGASSRRPMGGAPLC